MRITPGRFRIALLFAVLVFSVQVAPGALPDWKPVDPADLALKAPRVEKDADAEAIFWEVWVMDELQGSDPRTVLTHYVRMKIFTDRGREKHSTIDLPFAGKHRIADIAGRTIKPDGSILELKKDAVFERTLVKVGGLKVQAKSFAMPGVEPGALIEYRWREFRDDQLANYVRLPFQREVPVQLVTYHIKPLSSPYFPFGMRNATFHCNITPFVHERDGFYSTTVSNVPALIEEPRMPPEDQVRAWMLIYYSEDKKLKPEQYWKDYGKEQYRIYKPLMKVNNDVRRIADSIVNGAANDEEKLRRIFEYCHSKIKNVRNDNVTAEERADAKKNKTPADTLNQGVGTGFDIDMAFAALATAAGFDARIARLGDRSDMGFDPGFTDSYFLRGYNIAVSVDGKWRFYDPASSYVPFGMLRWQEEGQKALIADPKEPEFVATPLSGPEKSLSKRIGRFTLSEDGTLEGDVQLEYSGHEAVARKASLEGDSAEQRLEHVREMVQNRMSTAELTGIQVDNASDPEKPLIYRYRVKVPGYAQRTGKRLFLQLGYFHFNASPMFPTTARRYPIFFDYPWAEDDHVEVQMPPGYELDQPEAPSSFGLGSVGSYDVKVLVSTDRRLIYDRKFVFGTGAGIGGVAFPTETYAQLKKAFDVIHESDDHAMTLKQSGASK